MYNFLHYRIVSLNLNLNEGYLCNGFNYKQNLSEWNWTIRTEHYRSVENVSNLSFIKQIRVMKPGISVGDEMKYAVLWHSGSERHCQDFPLFALRPLMLGHCNKLSRVDKYKNWPFFPCWQMYVVNRLENSCHFFISNQKQFFSCWIQSNFVATFHRGYPLNPLMILELVVITP